jgi:DNA polymerase-1
MNSADNKLFLLDAYALIYRAYYALIRAPRITSGGFNTSAIFGFINTIDDLVHKEQPTHLAVCFDPVGGQTFRHEMFDAYKAGRDKQPEDITKSIPYIKKILTAMNIPVVEIEGYEADDVIGTLARKAEAEGFTTYMMTPDKDYGQLVTDHTFMYRPAIKGQGFEVRGPQQVCERHGISRPLQVIDLLALEGDTADNIPGCPGVGEKTAQKLIDEFDSVENLLANTHKLKGALKTKVEENRDKIIMSKELATICTTVPTDIDVRQLVRRTPNFDALHALYVELEFKSLAMRLPASGMTKENSEPTAAAPKKAAESSGLGGLFDLPQESETSDKNSLEGVTHNYAASLDSVLQQAEENCRAAISTYSVGIEPMSARFCGIAVAVESGDAVYVKAENVAALQRLFGRPDMLIVSNDVKRDMLLLRRAGIEWQARHYDTSLAHYLLQPEQRHTTADLAWSYLDYRTLDYETATARNKKYPKLADAEVNDLICEAAHITLRLQKPLVDALRKEGITTELENLEQELVIVLTDMEWNGVRIDTEILADMSQRLTARVNAMVEEAYSIAGKPFNVSSPAQVGQILFGEMQIDTKVKRTKSGGYSTTEEILEKYRHSVPLVDLILKIRALRKLLATYINALPELINPATGRIHSTFNQTGTVTGRLSSNNPNLQNIPVRTDDGREIRRAFVADPGCAILSADYSQIELRLMADISGDANMIEAFAEGADIHQATAAKIFHEPLEQVTDNQRRQAKTANFGIIYGISAFGLAERLGISRQEAKTLIEGYFTSYPGVKEYMTSTVERAREAGYVTTVMGRRRMLPEINSRSAVVRGYAERNAINAPLQGSAADIIKVAMVNIHRRMKQEMFRSTLIMQVHDELIFNVVDGELPALQQLVISEMESAYHGKVPLTVSAGVASNWLDAH